MVKELGTATGRNALQVNMQAAVRVYDDIASIIAETLAIPEGTHLISIKEGVSFEVAASGASDHHRTTTAGDKLYVMPGLRGYDLRGFGVLNADGATDDHAVFQAAIDAVSPNGTIIVPPGDYALESTWELPLSTDDSALLELIGYGATLHLSGAIAGIGRERPDSVNSSYTAQRINIRGFNIEGDLTTGQHGIRMFSTYMLRIQDVRVEDCDIGFLSVFGLSAKLDNCKTVNCATYGFHIATGGSGVDFGSGAETAITGGTASNSASNGTILLKPRVFARNGSVAHYRLDATEAFFESPIAEGGETDYAFYYEHSGSSTSRGFRIASPHIECAPAEAIYRISTAAGTMGGTVVIDGQYVIINDGGTNGTSLFDFGTTALNCTISMQNTKHLHDLTDVAKGTNTVRHPHFLVNCIDPDWWSDSTKWASGVVGNTTTVGSMYNASNEAHMFAAQYTYALINFLEATFSHKLALNFGGSYNIEIDMGAANRGIVLNGRLFLQDAESGFTTLGSVTGRLPVYDDTQTLIGYAPLYDNITA